MPSLHRDHDADPLGLAQDIEGRAGPLSDWKLIAGLKLPYAQIVKHFGAPPKAALSFFKQRVSVGMAAGQRRQHAGRHVIAVGLSPKAKASR